MVGFCDLEDENLKDAALGIRKYLGPNSDPEGILAALQFLSQVEGSPDTNQAETAVSLMQGEADPNDVLQKAETEDGTTVGDLIS